MKSLKYLVILLLIWIVGAIIGFYILQRGHEDHSIVKINSEQRYQVDHLTDALQEERMKVYQLEKRLNSLLRVELAKQDSGDSVKQDSDEKQEHDHVDRFQEKKASFAVVIFTYKRHEYLKRCLDAIFKHLPKNGLFEIFVSQDGNDPNVERVVKSFPDVTLYQKDHSQIVFPEKPVGNRAYYFISQHYKFGLSKLFDHPKNFERVIALEEDIEVAPDFFEYMQATSWLLDADPSLFCVSAFNDNGMPHRVSDPLGLYRSDFFPGLGWMMSRSFWDEIKLQWPLGYWDDWLRLPEIRKQRACIRPEISRTITFGANGVSKGQFYNQYLRNIHLGAVPINWEKVDLKYLMKSNYDNNLQNRIDKAISIPIHQKDDIQSGKEYKIVYSTAKEFDRIAKQFKLMEDRKSGVPRGSYQGVVNFRHNGGHIFLVPGDEHVKKSHMGLE